MKLSLWDRLRKWLEYESVGLKDPCDDTKRAYLEVLQGRIARNPRADQTGLGGRIKSERPGG